MCKCLIYISKISDIFENITIFSNPDSYCHAIYECEQQQTVNHIGHVSVNKI